MAAQVPLGGEALSALIGAHAALRRDQEAAALAAEACAARVPLSAEAPGASRLDDDANTALCSANLAS